MTRRTKIRESLVYSVISELLKIGDTVSLFSLWLAMPYGDIELGQHWLDYGVLSDGTKPLYERMLAFH